MLEEGFPSMQDDMAWHVEVSFVVLLFVLPRRRIQSRYQHFKRNKETSSDSEKGICSPLPDFLKSSQDSWIWKEKLEIICTSWWWSFPSYFILFYIFFFLFIDLMCVYVCVGDDDMMFCIHFFPDAGKYALMVWCPLIRSEFEINIVYIFFYIFFVFIRYEEMLISHFSIIPIIHFHFTIFFYAYFPSIWFYDAVLAYVVLDAN